MQLMTALSRIFAIDAVAARKDDLRGQSPGTMQSISAAGVWFFFLTILSEGQFRAKNLMGQFDNLLNRLVRAVVLFTARACSRSVNSAMGENHACRKDRVV